MPYNRRLDLDTMRRFEVVRVTLLGAAALQACGVLAARLVTQDALTGPWKGMSFATALVHLLTIGGLWVSSDRRAAGRQTLSGLSLGLLLAGAVLACNEAVGYWPVLSSGAPPDPALRPLPGPGQLLSSPQTLLLEAMILAAALLRRSLRRCSWALGGGAMALAMLFLLGRTYVNSGLATFQGDIFVSIPTSLSSLCCAFAMLLQSALERPQLSLWSQGIAANQLRFELFGRPAILLAIALSQIMLQSILPPGTVVVGVTVLIVIGILANIEVSRHSNRQVARLEGTLQKLANRDELTGLLSYRALMVDAESLLARCREQGHHAHLLLIDVDGLKIVNDSLGHAAGSQLLQDAAEMMRRTFRAEDVIGRYGGDEFVALIGVSAKDERAILQRLESQRRELNRSLGRSYEVCVSVGTCHLDPDERITLADAIQIADAKMYEQKRTKQRARPAQAGAPDRVRS